MPRLSVLLIAAALLAGCAAPRSSASPPDPAPAVEAPLWTPGAPADSVAGRVLDRCRRFGMSRSGKDVCLERAVISLLEPAGVAATMAVLDRLVALDPDAKREAHALAHGVGIAAYRGRESVGSTFAACPPTQISGCYHGVIQGYFRDLERTGGVDAEALNALCEEHRPRRFVFFQCAHGLGHGLLALNGRHLPRALEQCDLLRDEWVRSGCYGGVFMENLVAVTHPHNTAAGHGERSGAPAAGDSGHAHHHGTHAAGAAWKPIDPDDPLYPCTVVAEKYQAECYGMQTAAILHLNRGNVAAAGETCAQAPGRMARACFFSLGRDITGLAEQDPDRSEALCRRVEEPGRGWCLVSVAENLVNHVADARPGLAFCRRVQGAEQKDLCYRAVAGMLYEIEPEAARRAELCAGVEPAHAAACRERARVPAEEEKAAGLPPL
ncbi:MAG TPA: hypothetical protein VFX98_13330 [Longimicrobiaceae bacterium]|nr:hypothetical protein [Longimicrobiaceae bacterium]